MKYVDCLLEARKWRLFFDKRVAEEEAERLRKEGKTVEIVRERTQWTVFEMGEEQQETGN